jgi:hypothetical protein
MKYLVTIHRPDEYDPSVEDEAMAGGISALNSEMKRIQATRKNRRGVFIEK